MPRISITIQTILHIRQTMKFATFEIILNYPIASDTKDEDNHWKYTHYCYQFHRFEFNSIISLQVMTRMKIILFSSNTSIINIFAIIQETLVLCDCIAVYAIRIILRDIMLHCEIEILFCETKRTYCDILSIKAKRQGAQDV